MKNLNAAHQQHKFLPDQILYLVGDVNYSTVYSLDGEKILSSRTLKWYADRWPRFIRVHKAHLVNPEHIYSCIVVSSIQAHLIMRNGARLTIGRRRILEVANLLGIVLPFQSFNSTHVIKPEWSAFVPAQIWVA